MARNDELPLNSDGQTTPVHDEQGHNYREDTPPTSSRLTGDEVNNTLFVTPVTTRPMLREAAEANTALSKKRHQSHTDDSSKNPGTTYPGYHNRQYGNRISAREAEDKWTEISEQIDREARFLLLLHMRHDLLDIKEDVLKKVLPEYPIESTVYGNVRVVLMEKVKRYRYSLIEDVILHVKTAMNVTDGSGIRYCTTLDGLGDMFQSFTDFLQRFPLIADCDQLDKDEFHETFKRRSNTKAPKPISKKHALIQGQEYILSRASPPPPKRRKETLVPGRSARVIE
ncbi:hypothetical protein VC83_06576 [Pseudogymnoascus destructans]|uniref:Uncharacterized protein n=1 Tax=Pseudogymnoascus destructans TaxID=655981 RepID=A0A177A9B7_9PEZI|nr:uncharacterized protein VC83_06576 [Pseudogymnoascus destructans]OAF58340.1 hypothetical protein VC83_06576 [Pseudogymnoascus destructans]